MTDVMAVTKIKVLVTFNGLERTLEANPRAAVASLLAHALDAFAITANRHLMALYFNDNREITDTSRSIADWGIAATTKLVLRQSAILAG